MTDAILRPPPAILVLAAGASSRMRGPDKLLETVDGTPLILRAVRAACAAAAEVVVVVPAGDRDRRAWLSDLPARVVEVGCRAMSASIRAGLPACRADAATIHLADMPDVTADDLAALGTAWRGLSAPILQAVDADGAPGHPVTFAASLFGELAAIEGDRGAKALLSRHPVARHALPARHATTDLDTPEAWAAWRAGRPK